MVYFIQEANNPNGLIKIGRAQNPERRLITIQVSSPVKLGFLNVIVDENDDRKYHLRFSSAWVRGEWFNPTEELNAFISSLPKTKYCGTIIDDKTCKEPKARRLLIIKNMSDFRNGKRGIPYMTRWSKY